MACDSHQPTSGFLGFPPEIRLEILHHLLVSPKPIQARRNVGWSPQTRNFLPPYPRSNPVWELLPAAERPTGQILRTCRTLHVEGTNILYAENTFVVTLLIGNELTVGESFDFLDFKNIHDAFAKYPHLRLANKFVIDVHIDSAFQDKFFESKNYHPVEKSVEQIRYLFPPRLEYLEVSLSYQGHYSSRNEIAKKMLYDIGLLRANTANFSRLPECFAKTLQDLVMSNRPVVNLKLAFGQATVNSRQHGGWNSWGAFLRHRLLMLSAILDWDADKFESLKDAIDDLAPSSDVADFEKRYNTMAIRSKSI